MKTVLVDAVTHGRVLISESVEKPARGALVGFHGYGQNADVMMDELRRMPGAASWLLVSVQALHRFYTRDDQSVVASWMTRQDREVLIADNIDYVNRALAAAVGDEVKTLVFLGFSQGASMAARAAVRGARRAAGLIMLGGDIPPDVRDAAAAAWPPVLVGCGDKDSWYRDLVESDEAFLKSRGIPHDVVRFAGGHKFTDEFRIAAGRWMQRQGLR